MSSFSKLFSAAFVILIMFQLTTSEIKAQDYAVPQGQLGISASFQQSQMDILLPIRFKSFAIAPSVGLVSIGKGSTDLALGLSFRYYPRPSRISPYVGLTTGLLMYMPKNGDTVTDGIIGLNGGAECFVAEGFSVGIEGQLNATLSSEKSGRFGNPGNTNLNTAAAVYATIYF